MSLALEEVILNMLKTHGPMSKQAILDEMVQSGCPEKSSKVSLDQLWKRNRLYWVGPGKITVAEDRIR